MSAAAPAGPSGVASKLKGPKRSSQAEIVRLQWLARRRFSVSSACGMSRSHLSAGKEGAVPARMARKWSLNVCIARSAALRWTCGGTSWKVQPFEVMACRKARLASLSMICTMGTLALLHGCLGAYGGHHACWGRDGEDGISVGMERNHNILVSTARSWVEAAMSSVNILFSGTVKMSMSCCGDAGKSADGTLLAW
eukprot:CCRYP_012894-RA/>CCRYP_012894-RA protein AED:0.42 eAED:0.42 QI:0/-1/0/1/-1/1/1/0/195